MAAEPLTAESIALTEKKMAMTLDDIIKMSKTNFTKPKKQQVSFTKPLLASNATQDKSLKVQRFMDTRSSFRQGALAHKRSTFQENQFPLASEASRKAAAAHISSRHFARNRPYNVNKSRVGALAVQQNTAHGGGFTFKKQGQQVNFVAKQKPQTLDSRFANMKEQRLKALAQQKNRIGGGQSRVPWARNRYHN